MRCEWPKEMRQKIWEEFKSHGVFKEGGHFLLTSGRHSDAYFDKNRVFIHPYMMRQLAALLSEGVRSWDPDILVGPAMGGAFLAQATATDLSQRLGREVLALFAEKGPGKETVQPVFALRRGYRNLVSGKRVALLEDVVTTGGSAYQVFQLLQDAGATVVGSVCLVFRSTLPVPFPLEWVWKLGWPSWEPSECPMCREGKRSLVRLSDT